MKTEEHTRLGLIIAFACVLGFMFGNVSCTDITTTTPDGTITRIRRADLDAITLTTDSAVKLGNLVKSGPPSGK